MGDHISRGDPTEFVSGGAAVVVRLQERLTTAVEGKKAKVHPLDEGLARSRPARARLYGGRGF